MHLQVQESDDPMVTIHVHGEHDQPVGLPVQLPEFLVFHIVGFSKSEKSRRDKADIFGPCSDALQHLHDRVLVKPISRP